MSLYLVGENIDKHAAAYGAETNKLVHITKGVYITNNENIESEILKHSFRIAKYIYKNAYFIGYSANELTPTREGKVYIGGAKNVRNRIRSLEIIQTKQNLSPSLQSAIIKDDIGEFSVKISSPLQRIFEAERVRTESASQISPDMKKENLERFLSEYEIQSALEAVWVFGKENGWLKEAQIIEGHIKNGLKFVETKNLSAFELNVYWHKILFGQLSHNGIEWKYVPNENQRLPLIRQTIVGELPPFIKSLLPEGWLEKVLKAKDDRELLRTNKRFMSNISIISNLEDLEHIPEDILEVSLSDFTENGFFTGKYEGLASKDLTKEFNENLANYLKHSSVPKLSGVQIKCPINLSKEGVLSASEFKPFTHILKPSGTGVFQSMPIIEYCTIQLASKIGFETAKVNLINMPDGMRPSLLVERFDIRQNISDKRLLALEDFCSILDMKPSEKYNGTIEKSAKALRQISTNPNEDIKTLLKRVLFSWLVSDGDMHLKNMSVLRVAFQDKNIFDEVRFSPMYDTLTTRVFEGLENDDLAINVNGKKSNLSIKDFRKSTTIMGIKASDSEKIIEETIHGISQNLNSIGQEIYNKINSSEKEKIEKMKELISTSIQNFNH